eukprot:PhF_6_TR15059/c0_g1_i2/m.23661/K12373/HEXA_B; hexosaminidase
MQIPKRYRAKSVSPLSLLTVTLLALGIFCLPWYLRRFVSSEGSGATTSSSSIGQQRQRQQPIHRKQGTQPSSPYDAQPSQSPPAGMTLGCSLPYKSFTKLKDLIPSVTSRTILNGDTYGEECHWTPIEKTLYVCSVDTKASEIIAEEIGCEEWGHDVTLVDSTVNDLCTVRVEHVPEGTPMSFESPHAYRLAILPNGARIEYGTYAGLFYGLQTLKMLSRLHHANGGAVPCQEIQDSPRYTWRGFHLDSSRHFFTVGEIRRFLRSMADLKLNVFHWHLTDDQGWRVQSKKYPNLHSVGGKRGNSINGFMFKKYKGNAYQTPQYYTHADIKSIVEYAATLFIDVLPEIDFPAHCGAFIVAMAHEGHPEVGQLALQDDCVAEKDRNPNDRFVADVKKAFDSAPNCMGASTGILTPSHGLVTILREVIEEILPLFPFQYFHLGGDESEFFRNAAWERLGQPLQQFFHEQNIKNFDEGQGWITDKMVQVVKDHGKTAILWDDSFVSLGRYKPPNDTVLMYWRSDGRVKPQQIMASNAQNIILTPKTMAYMDYYQYADISKNLYMMQGPPATTLKASYMLRTMTFPNRNVMGVEGCIWSELMMSWSIVEYQLFPRMFAIADSAWSQQSSWYNYSYFKSVVGG